MGTQRTKGEPIVQAPASPDVLRAAMAGRDVPCTHCGYNLRDCASDKCPECGCGLRVIVEADRLFRRAWVIPAMLGVVALGFAVQAYEQYRNQHVPFFVPAPAGPLKLLGSWQDPAQNRIWLTIELLAPIGISLAASIHAFFAINAIRTSNRVALARAYSRGLTIAACVAVYLVIQVVRGRLH